MSKVICDICGTSYPETSTQCPICGCVRSADSPVLEDDNREPGVYTYVKGGRFSKSNVRKRNQGSSAADKKKKPANKKILGLVIVLVCLIIIVSVLIAFLWVGWSKQQQNSDTPQTETTAVACTGLNLNKLELELTAPGEIWLLDVNAVPVNTTDRITFFSSNEAVATVSNTGKITCVGEGYTVITVSCGDQTAECRVNCVFETATEPSTVPPEGIRLNRKSITADYKGFTWTLYSGEIAVEDIVWSSDDPKVATIENGVVTAVSEGKTTVHAEYDGVISSCEIICSFEIPTMPGNDRDDGTGGTGEGDGKYSVYTEFGDIPYNEYKKAYDITAKVGEGFNLYLKTSSGEKLALTWTVSEGSSCTVDKNYVKIHSSDTNCMLKVEYEGVTYYCYVRTYSDVATDE